MKQLAIWMTNRSIAWIVVGLVIVICAATISQVHKLENSDDLLAFLPQDNPDVKLFYDINKRFGGLDLAMVGIKTDDPFDADFLRKLQMVTKDLSGLPILSNVTSLTNVMDVTPNEEFGGVVTARLVQDLPENDKDKQALRAKIMSRDHLVGNLIAENAKGVLVYAYLGYGVDQRAAAKKIKIAVGHYFEPDKTFWGGQPFVATYIYDTTQRDLRRLTPWAFLAIMILMILAFRDLIGALLALLTTGMGIGITLGIMAIFGVAFNIVLSSMPIILFAIGSAFGIHLMSRYYVRRERGDSKALQHALQGVGPTITAAGLTTVVSMLSFVFMDIQPIRVFGFFTALGILITLVLSLTFIPAVVFLLDLKRKPSDSIFLKKAMVGLTVFAQRRRLVVGLFLFALAGVGLGFVSQVDTSVDNTTFFSKGSPPDLSDRFMQANFGGSQFVQIHVEADMTEPHALRELLRIADKIQMLEKVSSVQSFPNAVALTNEAMSGQRRIPDTQAQVASLYPFMADDPGVNQLVSADRKMGLIYVKVNSSKAKDLQLVLQQAEEIIAKSLITDYRVTSLEAPGFTELAEARLRDLLYWRLQGLASQYDALPDDQEAFSSALHGFLAKPKPEAQKPYLVARLLRFLASQECAVQVPKGPSGADRSELVAVSLAAMPEGATDVEITEAMRQVLGLEPKDPLAEDLAWSVVTPLQEYWRDSRAQQRLTVFLAATGLKIPEGQKGKRLRVGLASAMWDLDNDRIMVAAAPSKNVETESVVGVTSAGVTSMRMQANGLPVLHRGMSRSVKANQIRSLVFALVLVVLILSVLFRSLWSGLLAASPTMLTLAIIYGGMGMMKVHLDIGTSMLACIILGIGVDYAVHLVAAWRSGDDGDLVKSAANAADETGPAIWTNAIMICVGFFVLTLGDAKPLKNVGGLTAAAMLVAALATFLAIPALARKIRYRRVVDDEPGEIEDSEAVVAVLSKMTSK